MAFVTTEERVDRLEATFGQFMTEMAVLNKRADERNKAAEARMTRFEDEMRVLNECADERNKAAEARFTRFEGEMRALNECADERNKAAEARFTRFEGEMREFKDEMRQSKKDLDKKWGDLANKMGTIVEDILAPNLRRLATEYFCFPEIREIVLRWNRKKPNTQSSWQEFDMVIVGPEAVIVGEAKSSMNLEAAERYARKLEGFADFAPHLSHLRMIPVIGCWSMSPQVVERLSELGIYAMCMGEDTMEIVNGDDVASRKR